MLKIQRQYSTQSSGGREKEEWHGGTLRHHEPCGGVADQEVSPQSLEPWLAQPVRLPHTQWATRSTDGPRKHRCSGSCQQSQVSHPTARTECCLRRQGHTARSLLQGAGEVPSSQLSKNNETDLVPGSRPQGQGSCTHGHHGAEPAPARLLLLVRRGRLGRE